MEQPSVPPAAVLLEPGVGSAYNNGWRQLWKNFAELLLAGIIYIVMTVPLTLIVGLIFSLGWSDTFQSSYDFFNMGTVTATVHWGSALVDGVLNVIYSWPLAFGLLFMALLAARADKLDLNHLFVIFKTNYANCFIAGIYLWLIFSLLPLVIGVITDIVWPIGILLWIVWIVVFLILLSRLLFVPFLLTDKKMGAMQAIRTSWEWSRGHAGDNFLIGLLGIPIMLVGLICFVIGVIPASMWVVMAFASQYHAVSQEKGSPVAYPSPMVP